MKKGEIIITREYIVSVKELRKIYNLKGQLKGISLYRGRSPDEEEQGKDPDTDLYSIITEEITP